MIGVGWGAAVLIESIAGHVYEPQLAVHPAGNALAVWSHYDGALFRYNIMANRYE